MQLVPRVGAQAHCQKRFGVTPRPYELVDMYGIDDFVHKAKASRIVFTQGLRDGWSVAGYDQNLTNSLIVINFPNGAHHSDLNGMGNDVKHDTPDIIEGTARIQTILATWLQELPGGIFSRHQSVNASTSLS